MKAAIIEKYGDCNQLTIKEIPDPAPRNNEVLVRIKACSINPIDWKIRSGALRYIYPIKLPAILGFDFSGVVEAVGKDVKTLQVGDEVYSCSSKKEGQAYAQLIAVSEASLSVKPKNMDFKQAASVPLAAMTALQALRDKGAVKPNYRVLILGASGGVGMFSVQIAKLLGARVTAVCSTANVAVVQLWGADKVIDYKKNSPFISEEKYDVIFDCVSAYSYSQAKKYLTKHGIYIATLPSLSLIFNSIINKLTRKKARIILLRKNKNDLDTITQFIEGNKLKTHIDSEFNLQDIGLAHQRSETHRAVGKIIINVENDSETSS
ncbi:Quinone oxidoreductase (NADPH:quinone reductase) [Legionella lansingensis]|uniref:Quinone oxidoreductase (NADPH:quinone reductase) n=1 Tax=Legionella lansingensis TaxID=45067 RepID=A0A0W0VGR4_9GAMM|nr:NAD(P)-dependent alcohol dehydrogenase [Legionella lansingensis]KTD19069.1 Quinone oxidoreductase (NADPH:quinone reductase) [Legionella lansingensis]SNV52074.1 Quinone oxidoreductase (NADPH:quinone reductase) [Legionella lansingensis]